MQQILKKPKLHVRPVVGFALARDFSDLHCTGNGFEAIQQCSLFTYVYDRSCNMIQFSMCNSQLKA